MGIGAHLGAPLMGAGGAVYTNVGAALLTAACQQRCAPLRHPLAAHATPLTGAVTAGSTPSYARDLQRYVIPLDHLGACVGVPGLLEGGWG